MSDLRPAPYPADTRAKGWRFELDYEKIEQSDTWDIAGETPLAQQCLLFMWYAAWKQEPCGSMPADEDTLRAKCRVPAKLWPTLKPILMRGWWLADDGRLYHDTIVTRVSEMLEYRRKTAERVAKHKAAMRDQQSGNALPTCEVQGKNDTGTGTGTIEKKNPSGSSARPTKTPSIPCPYQAIVDLYHARLPMLPKVKLMGEPRQRALRKTWGWVLNSIKSDGERRATNADEALAWLDGYFARAAENDWLTGRGPRNGDHANWQCDLDFLLTDRGMKHVIEKTREAA